MQLIFYKQRRLDASTVAALTRRSLFVLDTAVQGSNGFGLVKLGLCRDEMGLM